MPFTINISESNNQLSAGDKTIIVPRSPVSGSTLPAATFQNDSSLTVSVSLSTSPFTESSHEIAGNGSWSPTWNSSVTAQQYGFTVSEVTEKRDTGVRPANGDIDIQVSTK